MKCRICGAELKKEGDICSNCYKEFQEEEDLRKDTKAIYKIKRKYSLPYELTRLTGMIIVVILSAICVALAGNVLEVIALILGAIVIAVLWLMFQKKLAKGTTVTFYEKKVEYKFDLWFIHTSKVMKIEDITDVTIYQTFRQKKFGLGDLCFYTKGIIKTMNILKFQLKSVEDPNEVVQEIAGIVGTVE